MQREIKLPEKKMFVPIIPQKKLLNAEIKLIVFIFNYFACYLYIPKDFFL